MSPAELSALAAELAPLVGARCQRIDVIDDGELVLELRVPGRTLRLLVVTRPPLPRAHLVGERPPKRQTPGAFQGLLRKRMEGRPLYGISAESHTLAIDVAGTRLLSRLGAGKHAFELVDVADEPPRSTTVVPDAFPVSDDLAARYGHRATTETRERIRRALLSALDAKAKRARRLIERLAGDARGLERHGDARRVGELLKTVLHTKPSTKEGAVVVTDWSTGEPVEVRVPVDPSLELRAQVERLFAKAKRAERGLPQVAARRAAAESELAQIADTRAEIVAAGEDELIERARASEAESGDGGAARGAQTGRAAGAHSGSARTAGADPLDRCSKRFVAIGGLEIRVGKGARENDRLTLSGARGHDLWLHARGTPGAHVLLRLAKGQSPPSEALLDAAHLAAHFSSARGEAKVEITYTEARFVRKAKGAPPGQVTLGKETTMLLRVEPARLQRLLGGGAG